jgi:hypothetical protein
MIEEELYILVKHANFGYDEAKNLPVYSRRLHLGFLQKELKETKEIQDAEAAKVRRK